MSVQRLISVNERISQLQNDDAEPIDPSDPEAVYELEELRRERSDLEDELGAEVIGLRGYYGGTG